MKKIEHDQVARRLQEAGLFEGLPGPEIEALAATARLRSYAAGEIIATQDQDVGGFFLVVSGLVKLFKVSAEGKEQTLYILQPGQPFCLCSLMSGRGFPANAQALESSEVLLLEGARFEDLARGNPQALFGVITILSNRLKDALDMIESLSLKEIPSRIAAFLLHEAAGRERDKGVVRLAVSQREVAKIIGVTPEALSRAMTRMRKAGLIDVQGREVVLSDPEALAACAEGVPCETPREP